VGSQTTEQLAQGDTMSITKLKNKLFNDKYREELNRVHQELEEQETEISNDIVSSDNLTELDNIDIQKFCNEQEAYESLDSLDSFNYMEI
jgi:molecular chaperone GrpE (heat shock protein)